MTKASRFRHGVVLFVIVVSGMFATHAYAQKEIVIGAVQAVKGVFAEAFKHINDGLKDSLMIANAEGGINGKSLKYIMYPSHYKTDEQQRQFNDLFKRFHPPVMFGPSTGLSLRLAPKLKTDYKILYGSTSFSGTLAQPGLYPSVFVSGPTYGQQVEILLKYIAKKKKGRRVAFFYSNTAFGKDPIRYARLVAKGYGLKIVAEEMVGLKQKDVSAEAARLRDKNPDYVVIQGFMINPLPQLIKACREMGMKAKFMGTFWTANRKLVETLGPLAEGYLVVNPYAYWGMKDVPMIRKIRDYNAKVHPEITYRPNYYMQGFVTGLVFVDVLRRADAAGELYFEGLVKALRATKNLDTGGLTAPLTIKNNAFPVAKIWQADSAIESFVPAPLPPGLPYWIDLTLK